MDRSNVDILAGHGYVEITELIGGKRGFNQSPSKWTFSTGGKPMWVTEASDDGGNYDAGIEGGLKLAVNMHKLLADCDASAYVFWLGMLAFQNNEALICTRSDGSLEFTKAYDVMGHYSRFIKANYKRINVAVQNANGLLISAYKDPQTGKFVMVVTNTGSSSVPLDINLSGFVAGQLSNYQTTATSAGHWGLAGMVAPTANGVYSLTIPAKSVSTLEGTKQ
ncbi:Glucuronoxylanase XynC precursor [compost metagenome]